MPRAKTEMAPTLNRRNTLLSTIGRGPQQEQNDSLSPKGADQAGKTISPAQVQSAVTSGNGPEVQMNLLHSDSSSGTRIDDPQGDPNKTCVTRTIGCAMASTQDTQYSISTCAPQVMKERIATGQEAASAQAVNRGHTVTMIEVPNEEDNTAYQRWLQKGSLMVSLKRVTTRLSTLPESLKNLTRPLPSKGVVPNCIRKKEVTSPMVATSPATGAKAKEAPHQWMPPFQVDWTL